MYKYSCRKCPIRNRCIEESDTSPSAKDMIRNAFAARTDTLATWGVLQKNCLLIKAEERRTRLANEESLLSRRLREVREAKKGPTQAQSPEEREKLAGQLRPLSSTSPLSRSPNATNQLTEPSSTVNAKPAAEPFHRAEPAQLCWLTLQASRRHIMLPTTGELVLGRYDPHLGIPPDVDLAYEDRDRHSVSRRHVRISGRDGYHTIEDLGSRNGLYLNGAPVSPGLLRPLQPGDRLALGELVMGYDEVPPSILNLQPGRTDRHGLMVAANGRRILIAPPGEIVLGRSDRFVDFVPDVDLGVDGDVAVRVSRRHAVITWQNASPAIEDLGSGFGTRLNGQTLLIGQAVPLRPGDHIWLGGYVLAYDLEF